MDGWMDRQIDINRQIDRQIWIQVDIRKIDIYRQNNNFEGLVHQQATYWKKL